MHFPERFKAARKMNGFSLQDLSDALKNHYNKQHLQRLETGESKPDGETVKLLSRALHVQPDYFFRETIVSLEDLTFRKLKKLPAREQEKVKARTTDFLERYLELEDMLGIDNQIPFKPKSFQVKDELDVENAAIALRKNWKIGEDALPNIVEMLEENRLKVILLDADKSFSGMSTIVDRKFGVIVLNQNREIPIVRQRFSALHELAHLYLDLHAFEEKRVEKLCDHFAACMLILPSKLREKLGTRRSSFVMNELAIISGQYGMSMSAIAYHAYNLGIITTSYHKFFMIKYNQYKTRDKEFTIYSGKENSERLLQLLFRAVAEEIISTSKAASLYNQKLGDFRELLDNAAK